MKKSGLRIEEPVGKVWPTLRAHQRCGAPASRRNGLSLVVTAQRRRFDWQALRFDDEHRTADDALLPRSSICRCLPVAFIAGWLSNMAADLRRAFPHVTGFSPRNVWAMRRLYATYMAPEFLAQAAREIGHGGGGQILRQAVAEFG